MFSCQSDAVRRNGDTRDTVENVGQRGDDLTSLLSIWRLKKCAKHRVRHGQHYMQKDEWVLWSAMVLEAGLSVGPNTLQKASGSFEYSFQVRLSQC